MDITDMIYWWCRCAVASLVQTPSEHWLERTGTCRYLLGSRVGQVYGPLTYVLYARHSWLTSSLSSLGNHPIQVDEKPYKLHPGGPGYELTYALCTGVPSYIRILTPNGPGKLEDAWDAIARHEQTLIEPLLGYSRG